MSRREIREKERRKQRQRRIDKRKKELKLLIFLIVLVLIIAIIFWKNPKENLKNIKNNVETTSNVDLEEQIYYSLEKDEIENNISILFTLKSEDGIKRVELPDGSLQEYDNQNEVKFQYMVEKNGEYVIYVTDANDNVTKKSVGITAISE